MNIQGHVSRDLLEPEMKKWIQNPGTTDVTSQAEVFIHLFGVAIFEHMDMNLHEFAVTAYAGVFGNYDGFTDGPDDGTRTLDGRFEDVLSVWPTEASCEESVRMRTQYMLILLEGAKDVVCEIAPVAEQSLSKCWSFLQQRLSFCTYCEGQVAGMESQEMVQLPWEACWSRIFTIASQLKNTGGRRMTQSD